MISTSSYNNECIYLLTESFDHYCCVEEQNRSTPSNKLEYGNDSVSTASTTLGLLRITRKYLIRNGYEN